MLEVEKQIRRARINILHKYKYFASVALMPIIHHNDIADVMATDGKSLYYNDKGLSKMSYEDIYGVVLHEILHCVFMHTHRRKNRVMRFFQFATDYAINSFIRDKMNLKLPEPHLYNKEYSDMTAEEIYEELIKPFDSDTKNKYIKDQNQDPDDEDQDSDDEDQDPDNEDQGSDDEDYDQDYDQGPDSDKSKNNQDTDNEDQDPDNEDEDSDPTQDSCPKNLAEYLDQNTKVLSKLIDTPDDSMQSEILNKKRIEEALNKSDDYLSKEILEKFIDTNNRVERIHWFHILKNHIRELNNGDYGYQIPNVRYVYSGFYLPSFRVKRINKLSLVIDVSGSITMRPKMLNDFFEHIRNIAEDSIIDSIEIITCNDHIVSTFDTTSGELMFHNFDIEGGGGTDLRPPFDYYLSGDSTPPDVMIYFTDLDGDVPDDPPPYPVIWVVIEARPNTFLSEPFGEVIIYDPPKESRDKNSKIDLNKPLYRLDRKTYQVTEIKQY